MSLHPKPWPEPSEEIVGAVLAIYARRRAPMPVAARDEVGELSADELGLAPGVLAVAAVKSTNVVVEVPRHPA